MNISFQDDFYHLNQSLHVLAKFLPGHIYWKDTNGAFLGCNSVQAQSAGLTVAEMLGKTDYDMPWQAQADILRRADVEIMKAGLPNLIEENSFLSDGKIHFFLSNKVPLFDEQEKCIGILGISLDITEQKNKEQALEKQISEVKITLDTIVENVPAHIYWKDRNCLLLGCNSVQARNMGFSSAQEMIGKSNYDTIQKNQPSDVIKAQADALTKVDLEVMNRGTTLTIEEPLILPNGKKAIYLSRKTPLHNEVGEIIGLLGISFDITKEKEVQIRETQYKLDGMMAVSTSIAHELRTPLASLAMATDTLQDLLPKLISAYTIAKNENLPVSEISPRKLNFLENTISGMRFEIRLAFQFIDMLLVKLRKSISAKSDEIFSMSACLEEVMRRYPFQGSEKNLIRIKASKDFMVKGEQLLITHVFFNLIKNAIYHIHKAGRGDITILFAEDVQYHIVIFKDTGTGIPNNIIKKMFNRFFTNTHHGAGVGLTFCRVVMKSIQGNITCSSEEGKYTQFNLYFIKNH